MYLFDCVMYLLWHVISFVVGLGLSICSTQAQLLCNLFGLSFLRGLTHLSHFARWIFNHWSTREVLKQILISKLANLLFFFQNSEKHNYTKYGNFLADLLFLARKVRLEILLLLVILEGISSSLEIQQHSTCNSLLFSSLLQEFTNLIFLVRLCTP